MHALTGFAETDRSFFARDALEVAPQLPGCVLERTDAHGTVAIRITEVEAYAGERDPGSHSYRGKTARNGIYNHFYLANIYAREPGGAFITTNGINISAKSCLCSQ